jgi:hypothetical protein
MTENLHLAGSHDTAERADHQENGERRQRDIHLFGGRHGKEATILDF